MRQIRAVCPLCTDEVDLRPAAITLHVSSDASGGPHRYGFECPHCEVFVVKPAGSTAIRLLLEGGVELSTTDVAPWERAPSGHPEDPPGGAPFTPDDVLQLHELLASDDWFAQLQDTSER